MGIDTTVTLLILVVPVPALLGTAGLAAASSTTEDGNKEDDGERSSIGEDDTEGCGEGASADADAGADV